MSLHADHYARQVWNTSSGLPQDTVRQFLQTHDGYLWMATDGGLVRFDGSAFTDFNRRNTPEMLSDLVNGLFEDGENNLWVATSNGLVERSGGRFQRFSTLNGLPSDAITAVNADLRGRVCATTSAGVACLTSSGFTSVSTKPPTASAQGAPSARSEIGEMWSPAPTGLWREKGAAKTEITMPEGFTGADILTIYVDREGDLWVGSANAGAAVLRSPPFVTLGQKNGLGSDQVRSVFQDSRGDIWFGTSAGLTRFHNGSLTTTHVQQGLASDEIITLAGLSGDDLWIGTPDGLSHMQAGGIRTLTASEGLPDDNIRSLLLTSDKSLWIGTTHGLAHLASRPGDSTELSPHAIRTYSTAEGLASDVIGTLLEDSDGSLWIGTRGGLSHLKNGVIKSYSSGDGLRSRIITALFRDTGGTLWVGTSGGGIYEWDNGRFLRAQAMNAGDFPETIYGILEDDNKQVWISSPDGIYRVDQAELHALAEDPGRKASGSLGIARYDVADGLRINDCGSGGHPEAIRSTDGHLFFATSKGVSIVNPQEPSTHPSAPAVVIENVLIDDAATNETVDLRIPPGRERIAFEYAGISFAAPSKVRYRYQLEPFDQSWIEAGSRRTAYYTNIPPGRYTFHIVASTDGGSWSETAAAVDLTIAPHFYQTWWFYTLLLAVLALIVWQLYLYRLRQVELRFNAVLSERGRIAREIHDTLAQDIVAISVQLDLVARLMSMSAEKAREQLATTRQLVRKSLAEARSSIWDLRAPTASAQDLPTRLREVTRQVVGETALSLELQITGSYRPSSRELEDELLRIAQEAVTNAVRHANPRKIEVSLNYHAAGVDLCVHDDGRGFTLATPESGPPGHYGLKGMHERAERANARLTINSQPGAGTTVLAQAIIR